MKKFALAAMLTLAAGVMSMPVIAQDDDGEKKFTVHGEIRTRWEYLENATDLTDTTDPGAFFDDTFSFLPYRARVSVHGQFTKNVEGVIELQNYGNMGNEGPQKGSQFAPTQGFSSIDNSEIDLYQAYIRMNEIGGSHLYLQIGRQEHVLGSELLIGDNDYYNGMSFDGLLGGWEFENWDLDFLALTINDRNINNFGACFQVGGPNDCRDDDVNLYGVTADFDIGDNGMAITPYLLYFRDGSGTGGLAPTGIPGVKTYTLGARWFKDVGMEDDALLDWNVEAAYQSGDIDVNAADLSHTAYIIEAWVGFNFHGDNSLNRIGIGALMTSGDDDFTNQDAEAFVPLFADMHANNRLGNIDFGGQELSGVIGIIGGILGIPATGLDTGITDYNIRYNGDFGNHGIMAAVHMLSATEMAGLAGSFGFNPDEDDLGMMVDLGYGYTYSGNLSFGLEASVFQPGDFFSDTLNFGVPQPEDNVLRVAGQVRLRF